MSDVHPLIALTRAYSAGKITLDDVLADLKQNAPGLFIEVPDRPQSQRVPAPKPIPRSKPEITPYEAPSAKELAKEQETQKLQKVMSDSEWLASRTKKSEPYDDAGALTPMY
jgi:hypothetical protein